MAPLFRASPKQPSRTTGHIIGAIAYVIVGASIAHAEPSINLLQLQVFAKRSIRASSSDYQGPTAAGSDIDLVDFAIDGDLTSGRRVSMLRGSVKGLISSPGKELSQVSSGGSGSTPKVALELVAMKLDRLSAMMSLLPPTTQIDFKEEIISGTLTKRLNMVANRNIEVVELSGDQLNSYGPGQTTVHMEGNDQSRLLVRILGANVHIRDVEFTISGGLDPSKITLFFPQATDLEILASGGAWSREGKSLGIPASVVAPNATLHFASALVTGQVFVADILPIPGSPSGQIDRIVDPSFGSEARAEIVPSQILQLMDADQSWRCVRQ